MKKTFLSPPMLAASLTPDGKQLRKRLENLFVKGKKRGYFIPLAALALLACGALVACVPKEPVIHAESAEKTEHGYEVTLPEDTTVTVDAVEEPVPELESQPEEPQDGYVNPLGSSGGSNSISSAYGTRINPATGVETVHHGVDVQAYYGRYVYAAADGVVEQAGWHDVYGNHVILRHGDGSTTMYGHLSAFHVAAGDAVVQMQNIGNVGDTGEATGTHLHFEIRNGENASVDPTWLFEE